MRLLLAILLAIPAFAGQSIVLSTQSASSGTVAALSTATSCTVEFEAHGWTSPSASFNSEACPVNIQWISSGADVRLQMYWLRGSGGSVCQTARLDTVLPSTVVYVRFSIDVPNLTTSCEAWDVNGVRVHQNQQTYTGYGGSNSNGATVSGGGSGQDISYGFFRLKNALVAYGGGMPYTADASVSIFLHWKWDLGNNTGSLTDASGNGYAASMSSGSPTYAAQAGQALVVSDPRTCDAKVWGTWITQRIGTTGQLCSDQSITQADTSTLTYVWAQTAGTSLTLSSTTTASPTMSGFTFGGYTFTLAVTDSNANSDTSTLKFGAADCAANGLLTPRTANVTKIYGPMICHGYNPWGYEDERHLYSVGAQQDYFDSLGLNPPVWATPATGTISYKFAGNGFGFGAGTTLSAGITSSATSIAITEAANIPGLAGLPGTPTWILLGSGTARELVRVCSTTATSGAATLTVCYNGRGLSAVAYEGTAYTTSSAWSNGDTVAEMKITGSGTSFATDGARPLCPAGVPGPPGAVVYSTGAVSLTGSSAVITGSGTTWNTGNGVIATRIIRIAATHGGGTSFVYWSRIASVDSTTQITVDRPLPSDIDAGSFSYKIVSARYIAAGFTAGGAAHLGWQSLQGCESETAAYAQPTHDVPSINTTTMTSQPFSYIDGFGAQSAFGSNFYGSGFALRAFYERSGYQPALDAARVMDDYWVRGPELAGGWYGGLPLLQGGGVVGAVTSLVLDPGRSLAWTDVSAFGTTAASLGTTGCNDIDTRDSGYYQAWLSLLASFDPDGTRNATWISDLLSVLTRDQTCGAATSYSYANGFVWNGAGPSITLTNGSAAGTGTGLSSGICQGNGTQTVTVTNGSAAVLATAGTFPAGTNAIWINGKYITVTRTDSTHLVLAENWGGSSTSYSSMTVQYTDGLNNNTSYGQNSSSSSLTENYGCVWNSSSSITLDRAWNFANGTYKPYSYVLAGFGQQPYMLGIKLAAMRWAANVANSTITSGYAAIRPTSAAWVKSTGYDTDSHGLYYGRVYGACESYPTSTLNTAIADWAIPGCRHGGAGANIRAARVLNAEANSALREYYDAGNGDAVTWGDEDYGAVWGYCPWTSPGYSCDSNYVRDENSNISLDAYKWPGFFFGMGMSHQWPAVRLGTAAVSTTGVRITGNPRIAGLVRSAQ